MMMIHNIASLGGGPPGHGDGGLVNDDGHNNAMEESEYLVEEKEKMQKRALAKVVVLEVLWVLNLLGF